MKNNFNRFLRTEVSNTVEKNVSFVLPEHFRERAFVRKLGGSFSLQLEPSNSGRYTFYDTFDWRLYQKSLMLYTLENRLTLRSVTDREILESCPVNAAVVFLGDIPESRLRKRLAPIIEMRALLPLFKMDSLIKVIRIVNDDQKTVVRLRLEKNQLTGQKKAGASVAYLFLLPVRGYDGAAQALTRWLKEQGFESASEDPYNRLLKASGKNPADYSTKLNIQLNAEMPAAEALKTILRFLLQVMKINEAGIKKDIDTEFLHDFRVAIRRTRSALSQIKGVFPEDVTGRFKKDFAVLGKRSNELRDLDVYLLNKDHYTAMLPGELDGFLAEFFVHLKDVRQKELRKVTRTLNSRQYAQLLRDWETFLNAAVANASPGASNARRPVAAVACERIRKRFQGILKSGRKITAQSEDRRLHQLRIDCKKLRYLLEFFQSLFPAEEMSLLIKQLKKLQDFLGNFQDYSVQIKTLLHFVEAYPLADAQDKHTILAIGSLIGTLHQEKRELRKSFSAVFRDFASPENQAVFDKLFTAEATHE